MDQLAVLIVVSAVELGINPSTVTRNGFHLQNTRIECERCIDDVHGLTVGINTYLYAETHRYRPILWTVVWRDQRIRRFAEAGRRDCDSQPLGLRRQRIRSVTNQ